MELIQSQDVAILCMSALAETRDEETGHHILRTQRYVQALAKCCSVTISIKKFSRLKPLSCFINPPLCTISASGIPDRILLKPGKLTPEEFEQMKNHTVIGSQTIQQASKCLAVKLIFRI